MKNTPHTLAALEERLRTDIKAIGTRALSRMSGVPVNQVHRFRHNKSSLLTPTLDRFIRALGYEVIARRTAASPISGRTVRRRSTRRGGTTVRQPSTPTKKKLHRRSSAD